MYGTRILVGALVCFLLFLPKFSIALGRTVNDCLVVRSHVFPILDILTRSGDIRDESRKLCKIDPKLINTVCRTPKSMTVLL